MLAFLLGALVLAGDLEACNMADARHTEVNLVVAMIVLQDEQRVDFVGELADNPKHTDTYSFDYQAYVWGDGSNLSEMRGIYLDSDPINRVDAEILHVGQRVTLLMHNDCTIERLIVPDDLRDARFAMVVEEFVIETVSADRSYVALSDSAVKVLGGLAASNWTEREIASDQLRAYGATDAAPIIAWALRSKDREVATRGERACRELGIRNP